MGRLWNTIIDEARVYDDPKNPEESYYDLHVQKTIPEAVLDLNGDGRSLKEKLSEIYSALSGGSSGGFWHKGTSITGRSNIQTVYKTGIAMANKYDFYLNEYTLDVYRCERAGNEDTALWIWVANVQGAHGASIYYTTYEPTPDKFVPNKSIDVPDDTIINKNVDTPDHLWIRKGDLLITANKALYRFTGEGNPQHVAYFIMLLDPVDDMLKPDSVNPVENKAIYAEFQTHLSRISTAESKADTAIGKADAVKSSLDVIGNLAQSAKTTAESTATELEEVKKSVSEGKSAIASTLTENGVSTAADATFETINENIGILAANKSEGEYSPVDLPSHPESIDVQHGDSSVTILLTYINTDLLSGVLVVYKTESYPTSPTDGESVDTEGQPTSITINDLENGTEYYFRAFLYNTIGDNKFYQTDVVNARITSTPSKMDILRMRDVGDTVKIKEDGEWVNFLIVHKGNPDPSLYDPSCDGVWLLRENAHSARSYSESAKDLSNDYENSLIKTWLGVEYYDSIEYEIREQIKHVKIPFKKGTGLSSTGVQSGPDGLFCEVFLLSEEEVGFEQLSNKFVIGAKLAYFPSGHLDSTENAKRICQNNDARTVSWWLRTPSDSNYESYVIVNTSGTYSYIKATNSGAWVRPAFILPYTLFVNKNDEVVVSGVEPPPSLEETDWETISQIASEGKASTYWNIGDTKTIQLSTGEEITVRIEDFDHDDLTTDGKAKITFGMVECLKDARPMNDVYTNEGGWGESTMRTLMDTLLGRLPDDLKKAIKSVKKTTSEGNRSPSLTTTDDKLWLFSYTEVNSDANTNLSPGGEGMTYPLFTNDSSRIKGENGWWLRSPRVSTYNNFCLVTVTGGCSDQAPVNNYGVSFGFCI